jgi:hypothetical protein
MHWTAQIRKPALSTTPRSRCSAPPLSSSTTLPTGRHHAGCHRGCGALGCKRGVCACRLHRVPPSVRPPTRAPKAAPPACPASVPHLWTPRAATARRAARSDAQHRAEHRPAHACGGVRRGLRDTQGGCSAARHEVTARLPPPGGTAAHRAAVCWRVDVCAAPRRCVPQSGGSACKHLAAGWGQSSLCEFVAAWGKRGGCGEPTGRTSRLRCVLASLRDREHRLRSAALPVARTCKQPSVAWGAGPQPRGGLCAG